jgi:hypothetical protein
VRCRFVEQALISRHFEPTPTMFGAALARAATRRAMHCTQSNTDQQHQQRNDDRYSRDVSELLRARARGMPRNCARTHTRSHSRRHAHGTHLDGARWQLTLRARAHTHKCVSQRFRVRGSYATDLHRREHTLRRDVECATRQIEIGERRERCHCASCRRCLTRVFTHGKTLLFDVSSPSVLIGLCARLNSCIDGNEASLIVTCHLRPVPV